MRSELMGPYSMVTPHTSQPFSLLLMVPSPTPISCLQLQVPHQPTEMFKFLILSLKLFIPLVETIMPRSTGHFPIRLKPVCLKRLFSKTRLPFLLILPIFVTLLPSFLPGGSLRRPPRAIFSITPWLTSRHFLMHALAET